MPTIVQQAGTANEAIKITDGFKGLVIESLFRLVSVFEAVFDHRHEHASTDMHGAYAVQKSGMCGAGKNKRKNIVLADKPKTLK